MGPSIEVDVQLDIENPAETERILEEVIRQIEAGQVSGVVHGYEWTLDDSLDFSNIRDAEDRGDSLA